MSDQTSSATAAASPAFHTPTANSATDAAITTTSNNDNKGNKAPRPPRQPKKVAEKPPMKEYKVLMIHGYTQSGSLFRSKVRAVEKALLKALNPLGITLAFLYPTAPIRLCPRDIPGWQPKDTNDTGDDDIDAFGWFRFEENSLTYKDIENGAATLSAEIRAAGGVDIVLGFSQGAFVAAALAAILETPYRTPQDLEQKTWVNELREANQRNPVKFAVVYSGFISKATNLMWLYEPKLKTPSLHILGGLDSIVSEERSTALIERCEDPKVYVHPGSHYVPVGREWLNAVAGYFKKYLYDDLQLKKEATTESD
ncbi:hypothetical protein Cpir12675_004271 [Ceratocystis pirilliformis]|uniref:Serine hydrolase domain-containing protein n=1 Tax=Ceratocystis pirilliformis TaxID=259994 RepID=A0ABR3YXG3_9PEZI